MRLTPKKLRWAAALLAVAGVIVALLAFGPNVVCTGEPPACRELHPNYALIRFLVILGGIFGALLLLAGAELMNRAHHK